MFESGRTAVCDRDHQGLVAAPTTESDFERLNGLCDARCALHWLVMSEDPFFERDDRSLRALLQTILASVPDAMIVIDEARNIVAFSAAAETLFGYSAAQVTGKNVSMLMTQTDQAHHDRYVSNYLETGEEQVIGIGRVVEARLANGDTIPIELKIGEAKLGEERLFTGYIRDVSEQRAAEHRIRKMQAELTNFTRLSAVGTMASAMAHELNQPLTAVANYLEAARDLLSRPDPDTIAMVREALDEASTQSVRAGQIIRRLRDYVARGEIETEPTQLAPLISDAVSLAKIGIEGALPRIIERAAPDFPDVMADRVQIRQVLINLVKNAIEAMPDAPSPQIWISVDLYEQDQAIIEVRDNGPGLSQADTVDAFQPFNSSKPTGMGLGLSICQTIIEGHGGKIWAQAAAEGGAAFSFTLKLAGL